jgi:hypothetical protein
MTEGVIVLPFFVIVLGALLYFHRVYVAKIESNVEVRTCAWQYATSGCEASELPETCQASAARASKSIASSVATPNSGSSSFGAGMQRANRLALAMIGLQDATDVIHEKKLRNPRVVGAKVSSRISLMCNEKNYTPFEIAEKAYCALAKEMGFSSCGKGD